MYFMGAAGAFPTTIPVHNTTTVGTILIRSYIGIYFYFTRTIRAIAILGLVIYLVAKRTHLHISHLLQ
jgi:hypothetical protein